MQALLRAGIHAGHAEDALGAVFAAAGVVRHIHVHGTDFLTFPAGNAVLRVALDTEHGIVTGGLQKHCHGADIFTEEWISHANRVCHQHWKKNHEHYKDNIFEIS